MRALSILVAVVMFPLIAMAGSNYDRPGVDRNQYNVHGGNGNINERVTVDRRGNMSGYDKNGNYWRYDRKTNVYHNYGTGQTCVRQGAGRRCY